jgi:hypothetical protein
MIQNNLALIQRYVSPLIHLSVGFSSCSYKGMMGHEANDVQYNIYTYRLLYKQREIVFNKDQMFSKDSVQLKSRNAR